MKFFCMLIISVVLNTTAQAQVVVDAVYKKQLENWQRDMTRWKMRRFVPLIGIFRLKEGPNTFGIDAENDFQVNSPHAPSVLGSVLKEGNQLIYKSPIDITVLLGNDTVRSLTYTFDADRNSERLRHGLVNWYIQRVGDDYYLRLADEESYLLQTYIPEDYYPANASMIFEGTLKLYKKTKRVELDNVIGTTQEHKTIGKVSFEKDGSRYDLEVLEGGIVMFTDDTNKDETFPLGRYLRIKLHEEPVVLDFNRAFSPPRSCSLYTTCDLPPVSNYLPFRVEAGEQYIHRDEPIIRPVN